MTPILQVQDLHVTYRRGGGMFGRSTEHQAVKGVSFAIEKGTTFGLVGESGAGKSTVGRAVLGLAPISSGSIVFDGRSVADFGRRIPLSYRRSVQVIFQDPLSSLNPQQTVITAIRQPIERHFPHLGKRAVTAKAFEAMSLVGLSDYHAPRYPRELSGGQRQRVAIARAVAVEPSLIVCDEPVSALDVSTKGQVINLLIDLQRDLGVSYLFVAHDLEVVRFISTTVGVMRAGALVEVGGAEGVYTDPQADYTRTLLASTLLADPVGQRERRELRRLRRTA